MPATKEERDVQRQCDELIEKELKEKFSSHQVIVDRCQIKPLKFTLADDGAPAISVLSKEDPTKTFPLQEKAPIAAKLEEPIYIFRVYADEDVAKEVEDFIKIKMNMLRSKIKI